MKVKLLRDVRPYGRTGDIAEVSPAGFEYLMSLGMAVPAEEIGERIETPEKDPDPELETAVEIPAKVTVKRTPAKKGKGK